jgi:hypothetical protein
MKPEMGSAVPLPSKNKPQKFKTRNDVVDESPKSICGFSEYREGDCPGAVPAAMAVDGMGSDDW